MSSCNSEIPNGCDGCGPNINLFVISRVSAFGPMGFQGFGGCPNKYATSTHIASASSASSSGGCRGPFNIQDSSNENFSSVSTSKIKIGKYGLWTEQSSYTKYTGSDKGNGQWWDDPETPEEEQACSSNSNGSRSIIYISPPNTECNVWPSSLDTYYSFSACTSCEPNPGCGSESGEYLGSPVWVFQGLEVKSCSLLMGNISEGYSCQEPDWNNPETAPPCEVVCGTFNLNVSRSVNLGSQVTSGQVLGLVIKDLDIKTNIALINDIASCSGNRGCEGGRDGCWTLSPNLPSFNIVNSYYIPGDINSSVIDSITLMKLAVDKTWFHENNVESVGGRVIFYIPTSNDVEEDRTPCCDGENFDGYIVKSVNFDINTSEEFKNGEFYATENDLNLGVRNKELQAHIGETIKTCISIEKIKKKEVED